jgi:hypothetical protein
MAHEDVRAAMEHFWQELLDADGLARALREIEEPAAAWVHVYCRAVERLNAAWEPLECALNRDVFVSAGDRGGTPQVSSPRLSD